MERYILHLALVLSVLMLCACTDEKTDSFQGYAEGEFVYVSSPIGGELARLAVEKGQTVGKGDLLFSLEQAFETAGVRDAEEMLKQANDRLANLQKGLRPSEIDAINARLRQAQLSLRLAETEYRRRVALSRKQGVSQEERERALTAYEHEQQKVKQVEAELAIAQSGAREDEIHAAEAQVESAKARLEQANWNLAQKTRISPEAGLIFDTFYETGEYVPPTRPVLALLPPENRKVRFFVPETAVGQFKTGQKVKISFDGLQTPLNAHVSYISPQSEYTPPVIYSSKNRAKLVFMLEALPDDPRSAVLLHPGQPVDVIAE
ncbi:MAG: HlyD family efflux transporter periplasmic adaptor subunit [Desulfobacterales bacterium]